MLITRKTSKRGFGPLKIQSYITLTKLIPEFIYSLEQYVLFILKFTISSSLFIVYHNFTATHT